MQRFALAAALMLAGCANTDPAPDPAPQAPAEPFVPDEPEFDFAGLIDPDHPGHSMASLHTGAHGLELTGYTPIQPILPAHVRGSITQVDVHGDWAVVSGMEGGMAFALVDISDPSRPQSVSWYPSSADGWTARFSHDGDYVFYGCQRLETFNPYAVAGGSCQDPDAVASGQQPSGVVVVDVRDKSDPRFVTFTPTAGSHNLVVAGINGTDYVFTNAVDILRFDRDAGRLEPVASVGGRHDATVIQHPITQEWLLLTGTSELTIHNVDDPADPQPVFAGEGGAWVGWHEQTLVPGIVDGRAILLLAGESLAGTGAVAEGGLDTVSVVDLTDPANPVLLSTWSPPFAPQLPWASYMYSVHEIAATPGGQAAIAWYHAGVWVLDVSTRERQEAPVILAAYQPHEEITATPATFAQTPLPYVPFVWGAAWTAEGHLVVPDMHTGLYVLEPAWGLHPAVDGGQ